MLIDSDTAKENKTFGLLKHWCHLEASIATEGNPFPEKTLDSALPQPAKLRASSFQMKYFCIPRHAINLQLSEWSSNQTETLSNVEE